MVIFAIESIAVSLVFSITEKMFGYITMTALILFALIVAVILVRGSIINLFSFICQRTYQ
jgi:hypothetical protein